MLMDMEDMFKGAGLRPFCVMTLITFAKIGTVHTLLETLTVLLLTEGFFAVAALKVALFFFTDSQQAKGCRLCRDIEQHFTLLS